MPSIDSDNLWYPERVDFGDKNDHNRLFDDDKTLAKVFWSVRGKCLPFQGEKKLLLAILEDALSCISKLARATSRRGRRLLNKELAWFINEDDDWIHSVEYICDEFGLNASAVREAILKYVEESKRRSSKKTVRKTRFRSNTSNKRLKPRA